MKIINKNRNEEMPPLPFYDKGSNGIYGYYALNEKQEVFFLYEYDGRVCCDNVSDEYRVELPEVDLIRAEEPVIICKKAREPLIDGFHESCFYKFNSQSEVLEAYQDKIKEYELYGRLTDTPVEFEIDKEHLSFSIKYKRGQLDYFPVNKFSPLDNF
jgi:hypothetical protein